MDKILDSELEQLIEQVVKEALTWSQESPDDIWYRNQIRPFIIAAYHLGKDSK